MRKSAAEYIRSLEARIARLERTAGDGSPRVTLRLVSETGDFRDIVKKNVEVEYPFNGLTRAVDSMLKKSLALLPIDARSDMKWVEDGWDFSPLYDGFQASLGLELPYFKNYSYEARLIIDPQQYYKDTGGNNMSSAVIHPLSYNLRKLVRSR